MDVSVNFESSTTLPAAAGRTSPPLSEAVLHAPSPAPSVAAAEANALSPAVRYAPSPAPRDAQPRPKFEGLA